MTTEATWYWEVNRYNQPTVYEQGRKKGIYESGDVDGEVCRANRNMDAEAIVRDHNAALVSPAGVDFALVRSTLESKIKDDRYHPQYILGMAFAHQLLESVPAAGADEIRQLVEEAKVLLRKAGGQFVIGDHFIQKLVAPGNIEAVAQIVYLNDIRALGKEISAFLARLAAAPTEAGQ